jgi:dienelactone hydrolase
MAYLFLPKNSAPPYQTVIYFPGSPAVFRPSSENLENQPEFKNLVSFIIKNGRAVLYPIYKGTFERRDAIPPFLHTGDETYQYVEYLTKVIKDFKRSIDYLETREDIDSDKLAYYGYSWGSFLGNIIPAVEERLKVSIIVIGGLVTRHRRPEADEINYVTRVKIPTLMLNGKYDFGYHYETSSKPMYDLLGTPEKDKDLILYDTDQFIPKKELIKETLNWLDTYFGPVKKGP